MAHGTRINGVNKVANAGFTRINGVNKKVKKGLTQVSGVQKDINFGGGNFTVTITGGGAGDDQTPYACLVIDWEVYTTPQIIELPAGTVISCRVGRGTKGLAAILLNEVVVAETKESYGEAWYDYTVNGNTTINLEVGTGAIIRITEA